MASNKYGGLRRRTPGSKAGRSNRIFRKFIRRSALRPELKYNLFANQSGAVVGTTLNLHTDQIVQGTTIGTRIGQSLKFVKLDYMLDFYDATSSTGVNGAVRNSYGLRYMIWSPRVDANTAIDYMNTVKFRDFIAYDAVTIYRDVRMVMHPKIFLNGGTAALNNHGNQVCFIRSSMKYPRKVHFAIGNSTLDEEKDRIYITFVIDTDQSGTDVRSGLFLQSKLWYFDV